MSDFVQQAVSGISEKVANDASPQWLASLRADSLKALAGETLPTRKVENWKYTNLSPLQRGDYTGVGKQSVAVIAPELYAIENLSATRLVFVNGIFSEEHSNADTLISNGLTLTRFSEADEKTSALIAEKLGASLESGKHLFAQINQGLMDDGVFVHCAKNTVVDKPIHVVSVTAPLENGFSFNARALVVLEQNAQATVVEHFVSTDQEQNCFANGVTELYVGENSRLKHYRLHEEEEHALHIGNVSAILDRSATLESFHLAMGSLLQRIDITVNHRGPGAHCQLNGVYLPSGKQLVDYHTCIEHAVPNCTTSEIFRGIIADSAKAVFNGRIHIHPDAQKTLAELSNKNLLLSDKAEVDTKPELEIYADDVQCAHGATVAQIDELSIHYLRTRGISTEEATVLLSFGFINELISDLPNEAIVQYLRPKLAKLFARDPALMRHLAE